MIVACALGVMVYQQPDVVEVSMMLGRLLAGALLLFLNIWTTQDNTVYIFSVSRLPQIFAIAASLQKVQT